MTKVPWHPKADLSPANLKAHATHDLKGQETRHTMNRQKSATLSLSILHYVVANSDLV